MSPRLMKYMVPKPAEKVRDLQNGGRNSRVNNTIELAPWRSNSWVLNRISTLLGHNPTIFQKCVRTYLLLGMYTFRGKIIWFKRIHITVVWHLWHEKDYKVDFNKRIKILNIYFIGDFLLCSIVFLVIFPNECLNIFKMALPLSFLV